MDRRMQRAFTLIELLVVVAIIALLISILLPSMQAARDRGKAVKCASNERQLGLGLTYYVHESGYYPSDHLQPGIGDWMIAWVPRIRVYQDFQDDIFWCPSTPLEFRWGPSPRDGYTGPMPAVAYGYRHGEKPLTANTDEPFFSYGYNGSGTAPSFGSKCYGLGMHTGDGMDDGVTGTNEIPERDVLRPADMIAIADSAGDGESDSEINAQRRRWTAHPGTRHFGGAEVLFADGHVVHIRLSGQLVVKLDERGIQRPDDYDGAIIRRWMNDFQEHENLWP